MTKNQKLYEKVLNIGVIILIAWHMLMSQSKVFFANYTAEMLFAVFLFLLMIIYFILCRFKWTQTTGRIQLITDKIRTPNQIICVVFFIWYVISLLLNRNTYLKNNFWLLFDVGINCLILFNLPMILSKEKGKKLIDLLLHIVSVFGLCIVIYSLWHLFTLNFVYLESGEFIGMTRLHQFEIGVYYNSTGAYALAFVLISFYMIATQKVLVKILYAIALIPHTLALILTNSRAAFVACVFAFFCSVFLIVWNNTKEKSIIFRICAAFVSSIGAAAVIWVLRPAAFQLFESITHFTTGKAQTPIIYPERIGDNNEIVSISNLSRCLMFFSLTSFTPIKKTKKLFTALHRSGKRAVRIVLISVLLTVSSSVCDLMTAETGDRFTVFDNLSVAAYDGSTDTKTASQIGEESVRDLNDLGTIKARKIIWGYAVEIIKSDWKSFLFGVTPLGFDDALLKIGVQQSKTYHAHNEVLNMGVSLGVPMMLALLFLIISTGIKCIRLGLMGKNQYFRGAYILPVVFASFVISTLVEAYLFASFTIMSCLFFLFCGWINALDSRD